MLIHFRKKSQEKSQEVHAYEDENFGVPSQLSTQVKPQQAMAVCSSGHPVLASVDYAS
jgi:hypothetical protein